jgi:hypothetical protein
MSMQGPSEISLKLQNLQRQPTLNVLSKLQTECSTYMYMHVHTEKATNALLAGKTSAAHPVL